MASVRINVSLPKEIFEELNQSVQPRRRSRFISGAISHALKEERVRRLALEYEEAAAEIQTINQELEGVIGDGLHTSR